MRLLVSRDGRLMADHWDRAQRGNRADWRWRSGFEDHQEAKRSRLERQREAYNVILGQECVHGRRVRAVGLNGGLWWAGLQCPEGSTNCGSAYVPMAQVYRAWLDSQPVNLTDGA